MNRWDGPDGQWAAFRERVTWGPSRRIQEAWIQGNTERYIVVLATEFVTGLHVMDGDGGWIDAPGEDAWERMNDAAGEAISLKCLELWEAQSEARNPKGLTPTPPSSPQSEPLTATT